MLSIFFVFCVVRPFVSTVALTTPNGCHRPVIGGIGITPSQKYPKQNKKKRGTKNRNKQTEFRSVAAVANIGRFYRTYGSTLGGFTESYRFFFFGLRLTRMNIAGDSHTSVGFSHHVLRSGGFCGFLSCPSFFPPISTYSLFFLSCFHFLYLERSLYGYERVFSFLNCYRDSMST